MELLEAGVFRGNTQCSLKRLNAQSSTPTLGRPARGRPCQLLAPARPDHADRVRQHPEQRQPHPQHLARPDQQLGPRPPARALHPRPRPRVRHRGARRQARRPRRHTDAGHKPRHAAPRRPSVHHYGGCGGPIWTLCTFGGAGPGEPESTTTTGLSRAPPGFAGR
jgi:hypothetical protein